MCAGIRRLVDSTIVVALMLCGGIAEAASVPPAAKASATRPSVVVPARSATAGTAAYAITDLGMPPAATYSSSSPVGFNNTGQIYGIAARKAKADPTVGHVDRSCLLWTGAKYVDLAPSLMVTACSPYGINSADPVAGTYTVVGSFTDIHHGATDAFSAHVDASGTSKFVPYYDHYPAALYGVNASGTAVGYSYNSSDYSYGPTFVTSPPELMNILQPGCVKLKYFCLDPLQLLKPRYHLDGEPLPECPFGGCTINDGGVVFGFAQSYALYTIGVASSFYPLPNDYDPENGPNYFLSLNNAGQLLYFHQSYISPGHSPVSAKLYDVATNTLTVIPPVAGTSCEHYFPISMNNAGEVLGFTSFCTQRAFYWTWDPVRGTQNLSAAIPANSYIIRPLGINDNAQVLVSLQTVGGAIHWGRLDPLAAATSAHGTLTKKAAHVR